MKALGSILLVALAVLGPARQVRAADRPTTLPYRIVDTGQARSYDDRGEINDPSPGAAFFGQDAQYDGNQPSFRDNGDGTVSDLNTGLMWQADPGAKKTFAQAVAGAARCRTGGHDDWRLPTIKELYSLILFSGVDPDPRGPQTGAKPFIDTGHFRFQYGRPSAGERLIDSQFASATRYVGTTMNGNATAFGVNFADGRIKGYPIDLVRRGRTKTFYVLYVRGNPAYGRNDFVDNGDGTVTDRSTGLAWMQVDSAALKAGRDRDGKLDWAEALQWAEELEYAGHDDWRLPNAKELHSIVDYARSPDATHSAAIDPVFDATAMTNEGGQSDYAHYWTSTSHVRAGSARAAVYIAFGRALGFMSDPRRRRGEKTLLDVHGAGAQRSDPKSGDPAHFPQGRGPQGDVIRTNNLVRCVRGGTAEPRGSGPEVEMTGPGEPPGHGPPSGADWVRRLDLDTDGRVSVGEFDGPRHHFRHFDRDGDGHISSEEAPTGPPPRARRPGRR